MTCGEGVRKQCTRFRLKFEDVNRARQAQVILWKLHLVGRSSLKCALHARSGPAIWPSPALFLVQFARPEQDVKETRTLEVREFGPRDQHNRNLGAAFVEELSRVAPDAGPCLDLLKNISLVAFLQLRVTTGDKMIEAEKLRIERHNRALGTFAVSAGDGLRMSAGRAPGPSW